jgi:hypothetical protein
VREDNRDTVEVIVSLEKPVYALLGLREYQTFKKDRKLKKIESNDRRNNLRESAVFKNDKRIIKILDSEELE